jgi:hypothetical protein
MTDAERRRREEPRRESDAGELRWTRLMEQRERERASEVEKIVTVMKDNAAQKRSRRQLQSRSV